MGVVMSVVKVDSLVSRAWLPCLAFWLLSVHISANSYGAGLHAMQNPVQQESQEQEQEVLVVEVSVTDADGKPVANAAVTPWALGCSMGHGLWSAEATGGVEATPVMTDSKGIARVAYPKFAKLDERVSTTTVSVSIDHPKHPYASSEHITVPTDKVHQFQFAAGAALEIRALIDGEVDSSGQVYIVSTSGRPGGTGPAVNSGGVIHVPPMARGSGQLLLVRLDGQKPTHFSPIVKLDIDPAQGVLRKEIQLAPAATVQGRLSDNVPRPVRNGRVKVSTIGRGDSWNEVTWTTWAKVEEDGTFVLESWPVDQPIQLIALCDGFYAESGEKPAMVTPGRARGRHLRAQVFMKPVESEVVVRMTPSVDCHIETRDAFGKPVSDVIVASSPNVGWWNGGSQIYCYPLIRSAEWLATGKYELDSQEGLFAIPFRGKSDERGKTVLQLPPGRFLLDAYNEKYQMPIKVGRRSERIAVGTDGAMDIKLVMQAKGLEVLGDWEDLCGLVFG